MSRRNRIFAGILLAYLLGVALLLARLLADIDPRYRESAEESLVETAHLLASWIEQQAGGGAIDVQALTPVFRRLYARPVHADIFGFEKTRIELRVAVVDHEGYALFDSTGALQPGDFHGAWRDINRALGGEYGARTSADVPGDARTAVMYVAVPIRQGSRIIGAVEAGKPVQSFGQFVEAARRKTLLVGATSVAAVLLLALILSVWLVRPFGLIADYWRYARTQRAFNPLLLARRAWGATRSAFDEMRDTLAGRNDAAGYVQTLTHELKSPLSAIRGAAELLHERNMPEADRARFVGNIERETQRIQELVDRMMELTALERQRGLAHVRAVPMQPLLEEVAASAQAAAASRRIEIVLDADAGGTIDGDAFLLRRALANLLDNAIDFSPAGGRVSVRLEDAGRELRVRVRDQGPGIPDYADDKVFEKFFSLPRPHSQRRSTGLGLPFVKEIAELHHGGISLRNAEGGGALATLTLPRADMRH